MVSYERLPMLEIVFDRLVRLMTTSLRNFTSDNVEVSLDRITSLRFGDLDLMQRDLRAFFRELPFARDLGELGPCRDLRAIRDARRFRIDIDLGAALQIREAHRAAARELDLARRNRLQHRDVMAAPHGECHLAPYRLLVVIEIRDDDQRAALRQTGSAMPSIIAMMHILTSSAANAKPRPRSRRFLAN